jgi:carboxymethylenebutenolidase
MSKLVSLLLLILVVVLGGWFAFKRGLLPTTLLSSPDPETQIKNAEMLETPNTTPIVTQSDVEYFPGAKGYFARPEQPGKYPGVVMIHENRGLRPEIKATADQLAREGYLVLAVDLYNGQVVETQEEARALSSGFDQATGRQNLRTAATFLRQQGADKVASLGWCFGGKQSIELAISGEKLDATVVYYGGNMATTPDKLQSITWPVLGVFGDQDQVIPVAKVEEFKASLNELGIDNEIYLYPGVGHAFANPSGMNYAPEETKDAWAKTTAFLEAHLK